MDEQLFQVLMAKFNSLETKVDSLIEWKYYFTGAAAAVSTVISLIVSIAFKLFTR